MTGERRDERCPHEELAVGWAMHALEPDQEVLLREHLDGCERCGLTVRSTEQVTAALGGAVRQEDPPARLRERLMAAIEDTPQEEPVTGPRLVHSAPDGPVATRAGGRRRRTGVLLAAAAVVLVAAAGGVVGVQVDRLNQRVEAQASRTDQLEHALRVAADPTTDRAVLRTPSGETTAVLLSGTDEAAVMPMELNANDAQHQVYVVWGTSTTDPVPLATFDVRPGSTDATLLTWSPDAHAHSGFAISLEPGRSAPAAPSSVVASGQVQAA
ncbi:anti-sigma factor [Umezawaea beigongshangensis]|uniref:anti-sigma factor n=1 Tax=Umezawaea beigongshangensis TaxID=2780383 RepID=UPI0018F206C9|nr:anti-sigma factor [Umezawaea beigongshangensis]